MRDTTELKKPIPRREKYFFRQRLKNKIYQAMMANFAKMAEYNGLTRAILAERIGKDPSRITGWLSGPCNIELDTLSDLLLGMDSELEPQVLFLYDKQPNQIGATSNVFLLPASEEPQTESPRIYEAVSNG